MNIFILDYDIKKSAEYLDNTRVVKMILETAQIISTVLYSQGVKSFYKPTHQHHPCVVWAGSSKGNLHYLHQYLGELLKVYEKRFNKEHSVKVIHYGMTNHIIPSSDLTPFVKCMPDEFKTNDVVESYRKFYCSKPLMRYFNAEVPGWFLEQRKLKMNIKYNGEVKYCSVDVKEYLRRM